MKHRAIHAALLALTVAATGALAQQRQAPERVAEPFGSPQTDRMLSDIERWIQNNPRGRVLTEAERQAQEVAEAIGKRDCPAAVKLLNAGLAKGSHEILVLAATMYEDGLCLKPNWDRAVGLLQRAHAAGSPLAAPRLAAGYAGPAGGSDKAAALWWALQAKVGLPDACRSAEALVADADRFVAAIEAWPAGRLDHCAYVAGVMATVQGQIETGPLASAFGLAGEVRLVFVPATGSFEIGNSLAPAASKQGRVDDASAQQAKRSELLALVRQTTERAVGRYKRPEGLDASWVARWTVEFKPAA
ncbi:MAG: hypothetical protein ACOVOT_03200 [Rubrivivax sp.]|jgi:hypothetical protein|nr:hypothetical protein [Rubrivivax sp.]